MVDFVQLVIRFITLTKAEFRTQCGGYWEDQTEGEKKFNKKNKSKEPKLKGLEKKHAAEDEVFNSFGYKATAPCPW